MTKLNVDCLNLIFNELQKDRSSLYSCLLVNREWCNITVPILWKEHSWYSKGESKRKVYNMILSCLSTTSKQLLSDNDINLSSITPLKSSLLFNYISFCNFPRSKIVEKIVGMVLKEKSVNIKGNFISDNKRNLLEQEIYKLFVSQCKNIGELCWGTTQP